MALSLSKMQTKNSANKPGFTLVELLIVIVIIAILATISIVAYNGIKRRAQVAVTVDGLAKVEKSLRLWMIDEGRSVWPVEPVTSGGVPFSEMINENPVLANYLQNTPAVDGVGTQEWFYDNDGPMQDPAHGACGDMYSGTNIVIRYVNDKKIVEGINRAFDGDANPAQPYYCGKIRWHDNPEGGGGILFFSISPYGDFEG